MLQILTKTNSLAASYLNQIRDVDIQKDAMRFRINIARLSAILAYEASKYLQYSNTIIQTPLGEHTGYKIKDNLVVASILRAGLTMHHAILDCYDTAENTFITAYRKHHKSGEFEIKVEYTSSPSLEGKTLLLCDPMIATGASIIKTIEKLKPYGKPNTIILFGIIASKEGIETIQNYDRSIRIIVGDIDAELTARGYIVPGLGDAGDLAYGPKLDSFS